MTRYAGDMLVHEIWPRLRASVRSMAKVGTDDAEELAQDGVAVAAQMLDSAEKSGKPFTAGTITTYTLMQLRSGRRSTGSGRTDTLAPDTQVSGRSLLESFDEPAGGESDWHEDMCSLHDVIPDHSHPDPSDEAAARIDWRSFLEACPARFRAMVEALAEGGSTREAGRRLRRRDSAAGSLRRSLASALFEFFGPEAVDHVLNGCPVAWRSSVNTEREKHLGRTARAARVGWAAAT